MWEVRHCASRICDWEYIKKKKKEYAIGNMLSVNLIVNRSINMTKVTSIGSSILGKIK